MKVLTYNIRGLGGRAKRKVIKKLIAKEGVELLCIQEIKVEVITKEMCVAVWRWQRCICGWLLLCLTLLLCLPWHTILFYEGPINGRLNKLCGSNRHPIELAETCDQGQKP